jgi:hypothetical protein
MGKRHFMTTSAITFGDEKRHEKPSVDEIKDMGGVWTMHGREEILILLVAKDEGRLGRSRRGWDDDNKLYVTEKQLRRLDAGF